jgi:hypothetical protein
MESLWLAILVLLPQNKHANRQLLIARHQVVYMYTSEFGKLRRALLRESKSVYCIEDNHKIYTSMIVNGFRSS